MNQLGPYELIDRIASGGMGEIYLARLRREAGFEKLVAVKRVLPHLAHDTAFIRMFEAEARLSALLNHRNIVHVYDFGSDGNEAYLAMEFVDGFNLRTLAELGRADGKPIPPQLVMGIGVDCSRALDYAYRREGVDGVPLNIVHRDVSPHNILVSMEGEVKVTDFGLAKALRLDTTTLSGDLKGKLNYMSPEQVRGESLDSRADLFSLGAVLYELLSNRRLYPSDIAIRVLLGIVERAEYRPLLDTAPELPESVCKVITKSLAANRDDRYDNAGEMVRALRTVIQAEGWTEPTFTLSDYVQQFQSHRIVGSIRNLDGTIVPDRPIVQRDRAGNALPDLEHSPTLSAATKQGFRRRSTESGAKPAVDLTPRDPIRGTISGRPEDGPPRRSWVGALAALMVIAGVALMIWNPWSSKTPKTTDNANETPTGRTVEPVVARLDVPRRPGETMDKRAKRRPFHTKGTLSVTGAPKTSRCVVVDSIRQKPVSTVSCHTIPPLPSGHYSLIITAEGFTDWRSQMIEVAPGNTTTVAVKMSALPPSPCTINVVSEPAEALVTLDGTKQGKAPQKLLNITPGKHVISLTKAGFERVSTSLVCNRSTPASLRLTLPKLSGVKVSVKGSKGVTLRPGGKNTLRANLFGRTISIRLSLSGNGSRLSGALNVRPYASVSVGVGKTARLPYRFKMMVGRSRSITLVSDTKKVGTIRLRSHRLNSRKNVPRRAPDKGLVSPDF
jgi:serine/threonine protein kinase